MQQQSTWQFIEKLLANYRLKLRYLSADASDIAFGPTSEVGLQDVLHYEYAPDALLTALNEHCLPNTFYQVRNVLLCNYILFRLPDTEIPTFASIGPYALASIPQNEILALAEQFHVPPHNLTQLTHYYQELPLLPEENFFLTMLYTIGEYLWGDADAFSLSDEFSFPGITSASIVPQTEALEVEDASLSIRIMEERYEAEQRLMKAVGSGQPHKAELLLTALTSRRYESRADNPLRDLKNYGIILNTLLRKTAENAAVHPINIDALSSQYAKKIELLTSPAACGTLFREMVRKYCLLVKNHSLKGYSLLVRKVITAINYDLTADLTLSTQAEKLGVNPSYLSTLFKKETGTTLTDYVNRKRIDHALLLLNTTDMQIQMIASYCGIPDVNYFTKTFKKYVDKTPKEYRTMISKKI